MHNNPIMGLWYRDITAAGVRTVAESCAHLKSINLSNCRKITDDAIVQLTNHCIQLTQIELSYCKVCRGTTRHRHSRVFDYDM